MKKGSSRRLKNSDFDYKLHKHVKSKRIKKRKYAIPYLWNTNHYMHARLSWKFFHIVSQLFQFPILLFSLQFQMLYAIHEDLNVPGLINRTTAFLFLKKLRWELQIQQVLLKELCYNIINLKLAFCFMIRKRYLVTVFRNIARQ